MSDRRRKKALDEGTDTVAVIMWEIPMLAAVRSTIWFGSPSSVWEEGMQLKRDIAQQTKHHATFDAQQHTR